MNEFINCINDPNNNTPLHSTFITDHIHGEIEVPPLCQAFLRSVPFDRLKSIKQLGSTDYVFPGATHTGYGHSLGTMHLAGNFLNHLMKKRPGCVDPSPIFGSGSWRRQGPRLSGPMSPPA